MGCFHGDTVQQDLGAYGIPSKRSSHWSLIKSESCSLGAPGKTLWGHPNIDFRQERKDRLTEENKSLDMVPLIQREETLEVAVLGYTRKVWSPSEERLKMCVQAKKKRNLAR